ncbi:MAG: hypothetical protein K8T10_04215 [Candidatus Eremiobacteraeota bacterium]|nr:hypothetical protein [Candidatus Eremiobacteraeota bacterium]
MEINRIKNDRFPVPTGGIPEKNIETAKKTTGSPDRLPEDIVSLGKGTDAKFDKIPQLKSGADKNAGDGEKPGVSGENPTPVPMKKWTILVYSAADNDLEPFQVEDVMEMEKTGGGNSLNLLVQLDRGKKPSNLSDGWSGARRYKIERDGDPEKINSPVLEDLGQVNMSDPSTLSDFIQWGIKKYPAKHYMLIISDHGKGWEGAIQDKSHSGWMELPRIEDALMDAQEKTGQKLDILGFDACLMGESEVAYQLRDSADYMVASEESEGAEGWPYKKFLTVNLLKSIQSTLLMKLNMKPAQLARNIVKEARSDPKNLPTLSAVDMKKIDGVANATKELSDAIIATDTPNSVLKEIAKSSTAFAKDGAYMSEYKDQHDFCRRILKSDKISDKKLKKAAGEVMNSIEYAVMEETHSEKYQHARGLSIHLPSYGFRPWPHYRELDFPKDTGWDNALLKLSKPDKK